MPKHEFGIMDKQLDKLIYFVRYEPEKYHCISVDDADIEPLLLELNHIDSYFHSISQPNKGLAYWGITLIPAASLSEFKDILSSKDTDGYKELIKLLDKAMSESKMIIHFGI